jgi:hypothetical protein
VINHSNTQYPARIDYHYFFKKDNELVYVKEIVSFNNKTYLVLDYFDFIYLVNKSNSIFFTKDIYQSNSLLYNVGSFPNYEYYNKLKMPYMNLEKSFLTLEAISFL